jgi:general secretion pathway protein I
VELLVAFMVLTLSLTVLFRIFSNSLASLELADQYARAAAYADNRLAAVGVVKRLSEGVTSGRSPEGFGWRQVVRRYVPWEGGEDYVSRVEGFMVTLEVDWVGRGREHRLAVSTLKVQPAETSGS